MTLEEWAIKWHVAMPALTELRNMVQDTINTDPVMEPGHSEGAISNKVRLEASQKGLRLWRNNVGAGYLENGSFLRWGLCNDSKRMNDMIKSSDLIGIRPKLILKEHVGTIIGQFVAREVKREGWRYTGTEHEQAQQRFLELVTSYGGDGKFATGEGTL